MKYLPLLLLCSMLWVACNRMDEPEPEPDPTEEPTQLEQQACFTMHFDDVFATDSRITIPNIFTPDDDGFNDVFAPSIFSADSSLQLYRMEIWETDGQDVTVLFSSDSIDIPWDGTLENGDLAPDGNYTYNIQFFADGTSFVYNSIFTLLRVNGPNGTSYAITRCARCVFADQIDPRNGVVNDTQQPLDKICP